jgi:dolichol-phosphate mannosyltransferase
LNLNRAPFPRGKIIIPDEENIVVVIPAYRVEPYIETVINNIPDWVSSIIVVDDKSPDALGKKVLGLQNPRVILLRHPENKGVGGAMLTGFELALNCGATIVIKVDGDNQAPLDYLFELVKPILEGRADYTKGNRFIFLDEIKKMPFFRRIGNLALSLLTKAASGYWNIFDPTNGFVAIDGDVLRHLDKGRIQEGYFFESSMLIELNLLRAVIEDIPIPTRYFGEESSLSISRSFFEFSYLLFIGFFRRLWLQYFVLDFSIGSVFFSFGFLLLFFGGIWGTFSWTRSVITQIASTTGTVMLSVMPIILGFQLMLQFIVSDIQNTPQKPLSNRIIKK